MNQRYRIALSASLIAALVLGQIACTRTSAITPARYKGRQLILGSGGGVTGFSTTYYLLGNGNLFSRSSRDTVFSFVGRQTKTQTRQAFNMAEEDCQIKTTTFDNPGNTYRFAQWKKGEESYKVTWGGTGETVPDSYPKLYNSFMAMKQDSTQQSK